MNEFENVFSLKDRVAVITGGATGIGFGIAGCMIKAGARVVLIGRRKEMLEYACRSLGERAVGIRGDVTDKAQLPALVEQILEQMGQIDILVNNAGISCKKTWDEVKQEDLYRVMDTHVFSSYALTQEVLPHMKKRGKGNLIFLSSMSSFLSMDNISAYSIAKSAVLGEVRALASEVSPLGIRVNSIAPGWIMTPMFEQILQEIPSRREKILGRTPLKEFGAPEDIGWAAVYLASDASRFVTASTLIVDGGAVTGL